MKIDRNTTNFMAAIALPDVLDIESKFWDIHDRARNEMLMQMATEVESIGELGIYQGTSFCLMMLQKPKKMVGVDITLNKWRLGIHGSPPLEPLAKTFAEENSIELVMHQCSSISPECVHNLDMLHIDSLHSKDHLEKELELHAKHINRYIAFHDTKLSSGQTGGEFGLWKVVEKFLNKNPEWELKEHYTQGRCGHAAIQRR